MTMGDTGNPNWIEKAIGNADLPSSPLANSMGTPLSRRHVIVGSGEPVAAHLSVTLLPSRTTMSVLVG